MKWKESTCICGHLLLYTDLRNSIALKDKTEIPARLCISKLHCKFSDSRLKKFVYNSQKPALIERNKASNRGKYNLERALRNFRTCFMARCSCGGVTCETHSLPLKSVNDAGVCDSDRGKAVTAP